MMHRLVVVPILSLLVSHRGSGVLDTGSRNACSGAEIIWGGTSGDTHDTLAAEHRRLSDRST